MQALPHVSESQTPLHQFISLHRKGDKTDECSFTGMASLKGNFTVKPDDYVQFLDLLHDYLFVQHRRPLNLVEQRRGDLHAPILIDLDFKYPTEHAIQRQFDIVPHIHNFITSYTEQLTHFYSLDKPIRFFISLRPAPYEDKKAPQRSIKDGIHIQCPDLILNSEHQQVLRHRAVELGIVSHAFAATGFINSEKDVFDEAIVKKNGWFFYGESKPDIPAYELRSVYVYDPSDRTFHEEDHTAFSSRQLMELLSIRHNLREYPVELHPHAVEEWQQRLEYCQGKRSAIVINTVAQEGQVVPVLQMTSSNVYQQMELDNIELAKQLAIECLSEERATGYQSWLQVGMCLHTVDPSEEMFDVWMEFSAKSAKAGQNKRSELYRDWVKFARGAGPKLTVRSLHKWAREDNPRRYMQIMHTSFVNYVESEVDLTHTHIARLMKRMYCNDYCASVDSRKVEWYHFNGSFWKKIPQGIELRNKMTTEVAQVISDTRSRIRKRLETLDENQRTWEETRMKKLLKIEESLYQSGFKDSVMKECIGIFYEEDFAQKLNANQFLMGFANGVLDLHVPVDPVDLSKGYTVHFRKAEPADFITFMAGKYQTKNCDPIEYIEYDPYDEEQTDIHAKIDDFMAKLFPKPELRTYMWRKLASCLEGANKEQTYETWIGVGGNGKSKLVDLMSMVLGDYASSLQATAMTRKRPDAGAANPDIMAIRNKRFIYMAEPDDREPLNTSRMKQFTGEDDVEARGLFEEQTKFKITGKIFMLCNAFPAINTMDRGTWRRVRAVPFESKFVDPNVEDIHPELNVYPRDNQLDLNLYMWRAHFMSRLVHIYKTEYLPHGLGQVPAIVTQESNKYQESFDSVGKFMKARIREVKKGGYEEDIKSIFRTYKTWYEEIGGGVGRKLSQMELYKRLSDKCGEPADKKTFKQMRLFETDEDIAEFDETLCVSP
jgi:P4 family phage/plasmid primase-like protien